MRFVGVSSLIIQANTQRMENGSNHTCRYFVHGNHIVDASITANRLQKVREVGAFDAASRRVCERGNYLGPDFLTLRLAPVSGNAALCPR